MNINNVVSYSIINTSSPYVDINYKGTDAEQLCEISARVCYNSTDRLGSTPNFLKHKILQTGHHDVVEHARIVFNLGHTHYFGYADHDLLKSPGVYSKMLSDKTLEVSMSIRNIRDLIKHRERQGRDYFMSTGWMDSILLFAKKFVSPVLLDDVPPIDMVALPSSSFDLHQLSVDGVITESGSFVDLLAWCPPGASESGAFTFVVRNVSRNFTHQIVRHRLSSFSQLSLRYVNYEKYVNSSGAMKVPPSFDDDLFNLYSYSFDESLATYKELVRRGAKKEDARFILPSGCLSELVVTFPYAAMDHFFRLRLDKAAQWEIREVAKAMYDIANNVGETYFNLDAYLPQVSE